MTLMCNSSSTNHLLGRIRTRDEQAVGELFARHAERLRQMVRLRLEGPSLAASFLVMRVDS
jgi:hypothetical protein